MIYGGFLKGELVTLNLKNQSVLQVNHFHEFCVIKVSLSNSDILLTADIQGLIKVSKLNKETDKISCFYTICDYYRSLIRTLEFCHSDPNFFVINNLKKIEIRSISNIKKNLFSLVSEGNNVFKKVLLSFGYISCIVVYNYNKRRN